MKHISQVARRALLKFDYVAERNWRRLPNHLFVFNFHRIGDRRETCFDPNVFSCTTSEFDELISLIKSRFRLLTLSDATELIHGADRPEEPAALLTFDDGYVDGYSEVLPVLRKHDSTGVFFLTSEFVGANTIPWWDKVAWWVRHATVRTCSLPHLNLTVTLQNSGAPDREIRTILNVLKKQPSALDTNLDLVEKTLLPDRPLPENPNLFMDWSQVKELAASGMEVGSHTKSHRMLSSLSDEELVDEIEGSRTVLSSNLGYPIRSLAYPVGERGSFDTRAMAAAEAAGYGVAFNFIEQSNNWTTIDPYNVCRIGVGDAARRSFIRKVLSNTEAL
jgi:peptidoglycan/xylan/chitin deacetylase (PgdA/CDA1 family)